MQKGNDLLLPKWRTNGGSPTAFWTEHAQKNTLYAEKGEDIRHTSNPSNYCPLQHDLT